MRGSTSKSILLVTFPVDLGNRTYETNFQSLFGDRCEHYRFAADHAEHLEQGVDYNRNLKDRLRGAKQLRRVVSTACSEGKNVLFHGISPALFSYGAWKPAQTCIILDWTRCLYPRTLGSPVKKDMAWYMHRKVLHSCRKVLCLTAAAQESVILDYQINPNKTQVVPAPFNLGSLSMEPRPTSNVPKFLFIGGDLKRKGGDLLLKAVNEGVIPPGVLTMVTNDNSANIPGVNYRPGIRFGTPEHRDLFQSHDVLILPTIIDSYPQVIGEAAATGLAVVTTKFALGAQHVIQNGVSGIIANRPEDAVIAMQELIDNVSQIDEMKKIIYHDMLTKFSHDRIISSYLEEPWC